jgi:hypothetical protein
VLFTVKERPDEVAAGSTAALEETAGAGALPPQAKIMELARASSVMFFMGLF